MDPIDVANAKSLSQFIDDYLPQEDLWRTWLHPGTRAEYNLTIQPAKALSEADFDACFRLIEQTSAADYKKSKSGWKPRSKKKEMKLLDLKYILVKLGDRVDGFMSFMPTYEDEYPVVYCYEIHLLTALQGTGLGTHLMELLQAIGSNIPETSKVMLTVFTSNERGVKFYEKLSFTKDEFSPPPKVLRNGTNVEAEYVILSKSIKR